MNRLLMLVAALDLLFPSAASAIDCAKAASRTEKMICADPQLAQLDAVLNKDYPAYVAKQGKDTAKRLQKEWLREVRDACADADCLKTEYKGRIRELSGAEEIFVSRRLSPEWDAVISASSCNEHGCHGPATVDLFAADSTTLAQRISLEMLFVRLEKECDGAPAENGTLLGIETNDVNFDGYGDFIFCEGAGSHSGYFDVYLYDPTRDRFVLNKALTKVAGTGWLTVNAEEKTLTIYYKDGPLLNFTSTYEVREDAPVLVKVVTESLSYPDDSGYQDVTITTKERVDGKWREREKTERRKEYE